MHRTVVGDGVSGTLFNQGSAGIVSVSDVTDRVDPQIEKALGYHQTTADAAYGKVALACESVQRFLTGHTAAVNRSLGHRQELAHRLPEIGSANTFVVGCHHYGRCHRRGGSALIGVM
jgi:hypothetical protein